MALVKRSKKDGSVTFQVKVKDGDGNWFPTLSFHDELRAQEYEIELKNKKRKGSKAITEDARTISVDEYWEVWSIENRAHVSEGWKISQDQMYRDYIKPVIGRYKMIQVTKPAVGQVLNRAKEVGLSDQTRKHIYSLMRKMFGDAVEFYEMLVANPVVAVFHRPTVRKQKREFLRPVQAWRLLEYVRDHYLGPAIWLQTLAALRAGEVQALRASSLQLESNQILICEAWNQKEGCLKPYPKQDDWCYVPVIPQLKEYLTNLNLVDNELVAKSWRGEMLPYETYNRALRVLCRRAGVPAVTTHELRHTSTEIWIQAGASTEDIRRLLNHASLSATMNYIHRTDERLSEIGKSIPSGGLRVITQMEQSFPNDFPNGKLRTLAVSKKEAVNA